MFASLLLFMGLGALELMTIVLIPIVFILWALIDILRSDFKNDVNKLVWIIVVIGMPFFGGILYYFIGTKQKSVV